VASVNIKIPESEKLEVLRAVEKISGQVSSVAKIADLTTIATNRVRFIIEDLIEEKRIARILVKSINGSFKRYKYLIVGGKI
jgi:hypothetical protein